MSRMYRGKKGVNCNKPLRREREYQRDFNDADEGPSSYHDRPPAGLKGKALGPWHKDSKKPNGPPTAHRDRPPPGLKGRALGLWYRDRNREKQKQQQIERIKPMEVVLNRAKQEEIEEVLLAAGAALRKTTGQDIMGEGAFRQSFLSKINVTFEEKLEMMAHSPLKPIPELDEELFNELHKKKNHNDEFKKMLEIRRKLPAYSKGKEVVELIEKNPIVVVFGETGCGKTTQVVQFILDYYILNKKGSLYNGVCTQPRRISAISVAERVAAERAEKIGESVGYLIRLESELPKRKRGSITFVTTGILIQWLQSDPVLTGITHLFIDEVHERDTLCDFLIALLKQITQKRPDLRIILMSATLNAQHFSEYFDGIPCLEIPGFTYPVEEYYLEDILTMIPFKFPEPRRGVHKIRDPVFNNVILPYVKELDRGGLLPKPVISQLRNPESEVLSIDLMADVIYHICTHESEGAILVFVPGLSQIQDLHRKLNKNRYFASSRALIIPMHSILPTVHQRKAFDTPPKGIRKIVIATSIAETSITIDDVVFVVDCGRLKTKSFDLDKNVSTLEPEWETLANAKQRRGRAGRTQSGKCYRLYTKARESTFEQYPIPEMQRTRLEEVILNAKTLQLGQVEPFLEKVMDPPDPKAVTLSLKMLRTLNILDIEERLTPLGFHVAKLPMDPQTGKMILMGALFRCLDPILAVAACLNFKDPFIFVLGNEHLVHEKRMKFSGGEKSDHYMLSCAVNSWEDAQASGFGNNYAHENFLSSHTLQLLSNMKKQFAKLLYEMKFLESSDPKHPKNNVNSDNASLIKAIVCSGLYPNVAMIKRIVQKKLTKAPSRVLWRTVDHPKVEFHIKSLLEKTKHFESPFAVYYEKMKSTAIYLHDATMVYPMALLFFGERLDIIQEEREFYIRVDEMIKFSCLKRTAVLVQKLRDQLLWVLDSAISNPKVVDWETDNPQTLILKAIVELITSEDKTSLEDFVEFDEE